MNPAYVLKQDTKRALIPNILLLLVLSTIFYLGILLNISLLRLTGSEETMVKLGALATLLIIIAIGIFSSLKHVRTPYSFYPTLVTKGKKQIQYKMITDMKVERNMLDKLFKTYSLRLTKSFSITYIPDSVQLEQYITKLVQYSQQLTPQY